MIQIKCNMCEKELDEPGGLLFDAPAQFGLHHCVTIKYHLCISCTQKITELINKK